MTEASRKLEAEDSSQLFAFFSWIALEEYTSILTQAGLDDLRILVQQMDTSVLLTETLLEGIGITKPGHRRRLLMKLAPALHEFVETDSSCLCSDVSSSHWRYSLASWLEELRLGDLHDLFVEAGYDNVEYLREHMLSQYVITDEVLKHDVEVAKPGHRVRVLGKLLASRGLLVETVCSCSLRTL